jgi:hypothetical protein
MAPSRTLQQTLKCGDPDYDAVFEALHLPPSEYEGEIVAVMARKLPGGPVTKRKTAARKGAKKR